MRILLAHNYYQHGGEDECFRRSHLAGRTWASHLALHPSQQPYQRNICADSHTPRPWNHDTYRSLRRLIRCRKPRVVHFNSTFSLISPVAYYAARRPLQTSSNYHLSCVNGYFFGDRHCDNYFGKAVAWSSVAHASRKASGVVAALNALHGALSAWTQRVDHFPHNQSFDIKDAFGPALDSLGVVFLALCLTSGSQKRRCLGTSENDELQTHHQPEVSLITP